MPRRALVPALVLLAAAFPLLAAQPQFWRIEGARDFLDGETEGVSVDSQGHVRLSPASRLLFDTESPYAWSLTRDAQGRLYVGTGNDGKVFKVEGAKGALFHDAPELEVHALAVGPDGKVYAGTSPDGRVYAVEPDGKFETFYSPGDRYIWALAFDAKGNLLVATGSDGKIHRVDAKGKAQVLFTSPDTHLTALVVDEKGNVYAGSSPSGVVYRIDSAGKVFVLYDSPYREVKALAVDADGVVYAAVIDGKEGETQRPPAPTASPAPSAPTVAGPEGFVPDAFTLAPAGAASSPPPPRPAETPRPGTAKGAVLRILPSGEVETLWSSAEEIPHSLLRTGDGLLVGTGNKGKIYRVRDDRAWSMVTVFPSEQVTGLYRGASGAIVVATSNPGKVYELQGSLGQKGTFTSKVKDTDTLSGWGRLRWESTTPPGTQVQIQTRSGNTGSPDSTWADWSPPYAHLEGDNVKHDRSRFLQVRATLLGRDGATPVLDSVVTAYLQRNLRPVVQSVTVHPPGEVFQKPLSVTGEMEILGLEPGQSAEPRAGAGTRPGIAGILAFGRRLYQRGIQTFSWRADDPNGDTLTYEVHYRAAGDNHYHPLRKGLTDPVLAWDTSTVPNGRYVIKVMASDSPSNPEALALAGEKESIPFDVDNTPPSIVVTLMAGSPARVRAVVKDDYSIIRKAEYSLDGGRWQEVHPLDGINDALEETYEIALADLSAGPHIVVVRATDLLGNAATARVEVAGR